MLAVVPTERDASELADDLRLFLGDVFHLPAWETLPFEHVSPNASTMAERAEARAALARDQQGTVVVASVRSATQRLSPSSADPVSLSVGDDVDFDGFLGDLIERGYHRVDRVEQRGELAVRGGIVDVFGASAADPVRVEFWGDTVESIRQFNASTQRSLDAMELVVFPPAREFRIDADVRTTAQQLIQQEPWAAATWERVANGVYFAGIESWMPWLAPERTIADDYHGTVVLFDPVRSLDRSRDLVKEEFELAATLAPTWGSGAPDAGQHPALYLDLDRALSESTVLQVPSLAAGPSDHVVDWSGFDAIPGDPESVAKSLSGLVDRGYLVVVAMDGEAAAARVTGRLAEEGLALGTDRGSGSRVIGEGIHHGFVMAELRVAVLGEQQIAGRRRAHRSTKARVRVEDAGYRDSGDG